MARSWRLAEASGVFSSKQILETRFKNLAQQSIKLANSGRQVSIESNMETSKSIGPEDMAVAPSAGRLAKLRHSVRYPNILASRNAPVLFVLICFLIIADTRCDQVGGTNGK